MLSKYTWWATINKSMADVRKSNPFKKPEKLDRNFPARIYWQLFKLPPINFTAMARPTKFLVQVIIENKPYINDPEGETIHRDLVVKGGYSEVKSVRSAKMLKMSVNAATEKEAEKTVQKLCEELRIFNPVVSNCTVKASKAD